MKISTELSREYFWHLNIGWAAPSHTYKVVCIKSPYCKVLTLQDGAKWRPAPSPPEIVTTHGSSAITVNGVMHFLSGSGLQRVEEVYVLCFDLESEEWRASIRVPMTSGDNLQGKTWTRSMTKLNDALCMVQRTSTNMWLIWLLTDPTKGTWIKAYTIPMASPVDQVMPLMVMHDGQKLLFYLRVTSSATPTLQVYDPLTQNFTQRLKFASNLLGARLCDFHLEYFVSTKVLPVTAPSVSSHLTFRQWLRQWKPLSLV
ncbi:hypothetical protein CFC21_105177 [Triticum aestivum]|uniref:F-box associated beta-propeller type 3 domain-containing protein n=2 Tax=Triticum aestivum TaxID=4565 RepID=A0A9R1MBL4_WHEAT|nr:hypothetical protein CFC21_105177 [Triticum aestivum]